MAEGRRFSLTRWARWAAAFALLSPALVTAKPIEAGWVSETIPKALGGAARETFLFSRMKQRAIALEPKGQVELKRATENSDEKDLFIAESKTARRHHYVMFVHAYRRVMGGFGPVVRLCRVSLDADAKSFLVATDIFAEWGLPRQCAAFRRISALGCRGQPLALAEG